MKIITLIIVLISLKISFAQDFPAYQIYTKHGKKTTYSKMVKVLLDKKLVFFGELHDNPIAHWLELEVLEELYSKHKANLICGSEMYEQDNQEAVNKYLSEKFTLKMFEDSCRLWTNQETDYQAMLDFAKPAKIPWVATNIPRKYASLVYKKGLKSLDSLTFLEKSWICPLPFAVDTSLSQYSELLNGEMHVGINFVYSQAIKDATMGYFISKNLTENSIFYHINGSYHSDYFQGILWYVNHYSQIPFQEMGTISTVTQENISSLDQEFFGKADFIICIPEKMTRTH